MASVNEPLQTETRGAHDAALLARIIDRDETAVGLLYDRYGGLVYTIAMRITGDRQTAEEVVQDVFQGVWQTAGTFRAETGNLAGWIVGIARHRSIDAIRSKRERARSREQSIEGEVFSSPDGDPEDTAVQTDLRRIVRDALADLPPNQRQAIELAYYGGLTRGEIAERLGEPIGTVKTRLRLGLHKLRDLLRPNAE